MAADAQDRLYLLTASGPSTHASLRVLRTTADGALDPTFGNGWIIHRVSAAHC